MLGGERRRGSRRRVPTPARIHRTALAAIALSMLAGLVLSLFIVQALEIRALRRDFQDLRDAQELATIEQTALRERLAERDDSAAIETAARERLGWVRPGEEKVIFIGKEEE